MAVPEGYTKLGLVGYSFKGSYSGTATYNRYNCVNYSGSTYVALVDNLTGVTPETGANWAILANGATEEDIEAIKRNVSTLQTDVGELQGNVGDIITEVTDNTTNITSNATRISSLESLQSVVPSTADEADIMILTPQQTAKVTSISAFSASAMMGYIVSSKSLTMGGTINASEMTYTLQLFTQGQKMLFLKSRDRYGKYTFAHQLLNYDTICTGPSYISGNLANTLSLLAREVAYAGGSLRLGGYTTTGGRPTLAYSWYLNPIHPDQAFTMDTDVNFEIAYYKFLPPTTANSLASDGIALANETEEVNNVEYITIPAVPDGFYDEMKAELLESGLTEEEANAQIEAQKERQAKAEEEARARQTE